MIPIDEHLEASADALRDGVSKHKGPGVDGIARASQRRRQRRAVTAAAIVLCVGLIAAFARPSGDNEIDVAARNPEARAEAIDACRTSFEALVERDGNAILATEGVDLRSVDAQAMDVASVLSSNGEFASVTLTDPAITHRCLGDQGGTQSSSSFSASPDPVPANGLWVDDLAIFGPEPVLLAGRVGADVVAIEAELADFGPGEFWIEEGRFLMVAPPYEAADFVPLSELLLTWTLADGTMRSGDALSALGRSNPPVDDEDDRGIAIDRCEAELVSQVTNAGTVSALGRLELSPDGSTDEWFQVRTFDEDYGRLVPVVFEHSEAFAYCLATEGAVLDFEVVAASPFFLPEDGSGVEVFAARFDIETDTTPAAEVPFIVGRVGFDVQSVGLAADREQATFEPRLLGATNGRWFIITGGLPEDTVVDTAELDLTMVDGTTVRVPLADLIQPRG